MRKKKEKNTANTLSVDLFGQLIGSWFMLFIGHSLRLNADVAARAWVFLGSLIVGGKFILRSLIHD